MGKVRKILSSSYFLDITVLIFLIVVCAVFLGNHFVWIFSDRGREFLFPQMFLEGLKPYKDITLIYFPLGYYINAFVYKVLGVNFSSLLISQSIVCSLFISVFYLISREFLPRFLALFFNIFLVSCCIFASNDLFSYIMPYSYSRVYGILGAGLFLYCFIKLFKTEKIVYLYLASLFTGFSLSSKLEFFCVFLMFIFGLFLYKRLTVKEYFKAFLCFLCFPLISLFLLFGVSFSEIKDSIKFAFDFASTPVMTQFLSLAGLYPFELRENFRQFLVDLPSFLSVLAVTMGCFFVNLKCRRIISVPVLILGIAFLYYISFGKNEFWVWVPFAFLLLLLSGFNKIKTDKTVLFLVISCLFFGQREFFKLSVIDYGTYSLPFIFLGFLAIINKIFSEKNTEKYLSFLLLSFSLVYFFGLFSERYISNYKIETPKGSIYTTENNKKLIAGAVDYILNNTDKNDTLLVLPEGNIFNFITDRKVDLKCFMMDRLYHDAYGEKRAKEKIENSKSDYIFIIKNDDIYDFERPELYSENSETESAKYIFADYEKQTRISGKDENNFIDIYKRVEK